MHPYLPARESHGNVDCAIRKKLRKKQKLKLYVWKRTKRNNLLRCLPVLGICMASSAPVFADPSSALDRVSVSVGALHAEPTFKAGVETPYGRADTPERDHSSVTIPRVRHGPSLFLKARF